MLSKKCKYAIHALVYMARKPKEKSLIKEIASACHIPKKFLETILLELKQAGILDSKQGKTGGYFLKRTPSDINLAEVIRLLDGAIAAIPCATHAYYESCKQCDDETTCSIRFAFMQIRNASVEMLKKDTLATLIKRENRLKKEKMR